MFSGKQGPCQKEFGSRIKAFHLIGVEVEICKTDPGYYRHWSTSRRISSVGHVNRASLGLGAKRNSLEALCFKAFCDTVLGSGPIKFLAAAAPA